MNPSEEPLGRSLGQSLLVVDDERFFRERIGELLDEAKIAHVQAASGEEALQLGLDRSVGGVILDIELPDISGIEVLRKLWILSCMPIIATSNGVKLI